MQGAQQSIDGSLLALLDDELGARLLARLTPADLRSLAEDLYRGDIYRSATTARRALGCLGRTRVTEAAVTAHLEHVLWASWRSATRQAQRATWQADGLEFLLETSGQPTILVTPYTVPWADTLSFAEAYAADRPLVFYGEGLSPLPSHATTHPDLYVLGGASARDSMTILRALDRGGIFCTFCDFVYEGHAATEGTLFGQPRLYSSSFLSFCARAGVHLLPLLLTREGEVMRASIHAPIVFDLPAGTDKAKARQLMAHTVAQLLERLICQRPEQWLLLPTLAAKVCRSLPPSGTATAECRAKPVTTTIRGE